MRLSGEWHVIARAGSDGATYDGAFASLVCAAHLLVELTTAAVVAREHQQYRSILIF